MAKEFLKTNVENFSYGPHCNRNIKMDAIDASSLKKMHNVGRKKIKIKH